MKTQLLEDIGQSATLSLGPSGKVANSRAGQEVPAVVQAIAQAAAAMPVRPRSASGVWRQKPAGEPGAIVTQQPAQQPTPAAPLAAEPTAPNEAQRVAPQQVHEEAIPRAEPTLSASATQSETAPQGPVFDFAPASPTAPAPDPSKPEPTWFKRSGQRYLLWGSCVLSGALIIQAGLWLYGGRKDHSVVAVVADELKVEPQAGKAVKRRATGLKEFTLGSDGEVRVTSAAPASSPILLPSAASAVPPLVMLEPEPASATRLKPAPAPEAERGKLQARPKPEHVTKQAPVAALPKRERRIEREQFVAASTLERARVGRVPARQLEREPVMPAEKKTGSVSASAATLQACKEHGYRAAQCVKRACSVTKYGFVCHG